MHLMWWNTYLVMKAFTQAVSLEYETAREILMDKEDNIRIVNN